VPHDQPIPTEERGGSNLNFGGNIQNVTDRGEKPASETEALKYCQYFDSDWIAAN
jgi:hypothetical protein